MPRYEYQCDDCGLRFEASAPPAKHREPAKCECGQMAPRAMPADLNGVFNQTVTGPVPQNTGIHSLDAHIDRVIGQSARQGWEQEDLRRQEKRRLLATTGAKTEDLSMNVDGTYRVRKGEEKALHNRAVAINLAAQDALKKPSS